MVDVGVAILVIFILALTLLFSYLLQHQMRMTLFKILFILLFIFLLSGWYVINTDDIDITSAEGKVEFLKSYVTWAGNVVSSVKEITGNLIRADWRGFIE